MKNIVIKWAVFLTAFLISLEVSAKRQSFWSGDRRTWTDPRS